MKMRSELVAALTLGVSSAAFAAGGQMGSAMILQHARDAKFGALPGVSACVSIAPLHGSFAKGSSTSMVRMKPGCTVARHWHTPSEELVVLQGAPYAQMGDAKPVTLLVGSYSQLPSHHVHRFRCVSKVDCVLFLAADGPFDIHYVDKAGKEIPAAQANSLAENDHSAW